MVVKEDIFSKRQRGKEKAEGDELRLKEERQISSVPKNCHENALVSQVAGKYNKSLAYI